MNSAVPYSVLTVYILDQPRGYIDVRLSVYLFVDVHTFENLDLRDY